MGRGVEEGVKTKKGGGRERERRGGEGKERERRGIRS